MLTPEYLTSVPDRMVDLYSELEMDILKSMSRRIGELEILSSAEWEYRKLREMGLLHDEIIEKLSSITGRRKQELRKLFNDAGLKGTASDIRTYRMQGLNPTPLNANIALQGILQAGLDRTEATFENLTRTTAQEATKQFERALDRAYTQVSTGAFSYDTAIRNAIKDLSGGLNAVQYPSGRVDTLEVAVRRSVLTGVNQNSLELADKLADEMQSDLIQVTAHAGARVTDRIEPANHASWQGRVYSRSGEHDKYPSLVDVTGYGTIEGLGGVNCRHNMFVFFEGMREKTEEELEALNKPMYKYQGQELTEYEATQRQRYFERQVRKWKREAEMLKVARQDPTIAQAKVYQWQKKLRGFISETGLKRQPSREQITF